MNNKEQYPYNPISITSRAVEAARVAVASITQKVSPNYICITSDCGREGGVKVSKKDTNHGHPCPVEGDICASWVCNAAGICDA